MVKRPWAVTTSQEQRVGLMQELDHYHDAMKTLLNFHLEPGVDPRFG